MFWCNVNESGKVLLTTPPRRITSQALSYLPGHFFKLGCVSGIGPEDKKPFQEKKSKSFSFPINQLGLIYDLVSFGPILEKPKPNIIDA